MSLRLKALNLGLRATVKRSLKRMKDPLHARRQIERAADWGLRPPPFTLFLPAVMQTRAGTGLPVLWISNAPASRPPLPNKVVLYFHGGGYVAGSAHSHRNMLARLARLSGLRVCAVDYRLAPEHPFPAGFDDCVAAFDALLGRGYRPDDIVIGGDSAGGGLALAVMMHLCAQGRAPAAVFALSPLVDMRFVNPSITQNAKRDPLLPAAQAKNVTDWYLSGHAPDDPRASPLMAKLKAPPPPVFLQFSNAEILRDDSLKMAAHLRDSGGEVTLDPWPDTPHVFAYFDGLIPEARVALGRVAEFVRAHASDGAPTR